MSQFGVFAVRTWGLRHELGGCHTLVLHLEGVGSLGEQVGGILILVFAAAEEAEAGASARERLFCLHCSSAVQVSSGSGSMASTISHQRGQRGRGEGRGGVPSEAEHEDLAPWRGIVC